jgi:hypothetical protein
MSTQKGRMELEVGLTKAIQWIDDQRKGEGAKPVAKLIDEASFRFELTPLQADFLYRHFTG